VTNYYNQMPTSHITLICNSHHRIHRYATFKN